MKILFCDNSLRELINFREDIINTYLNEGHSVVLVAPETNGKELENQKASYIPIRMERSGMNPLNDIKYFLTLYKIYKKEKPDYIFHYTIKPNIYGSIAARLNRIPSTSMIAGLGYVFGKNGIKPFVGRTLYKLAMRYPEHIFVLNKYNHDLILEKKIGRESQLILLEGGEGVNLDKFV